jgi:uncharacterized protein
MATVSGKKRRTIVDSSAADGKSFDALTGATVLFVGAAITAFLFLYNPVLHPFELYHLVNDAVLLWIPLMVILLFLRQEPSEFGLSSGDRPWGYRWVLIGIICMIPLLWYVSTKPEFQNYYGVTLSQQLAFGGYAFASYLKPPLHIQGLLYYEAVMCLYFFCWEFFFRGFLLFGLAKFKLLGPWGAVFVQALPFTLLHWSLVAAAAKPPLEIISAFFGGLLLGALAVRTKSFFYGFIIHWTISLGLDLFFILPYIIHHGN